MKNLLKLYLGILLCMCSITSCKTSVVGVRTDKITIDDFPEFRKQCIGQTHNQIVTKLGAPQREATDGNGGKILIYENTTTTTISNTLSTAYNVNYFTKTYTPGAQTTSTVSTNTEYLHYFINPQGVCYEVKTNIPMSHVEESEPYEYTYKKIRWGKTIGLIAGIYGGIVVLAGIIGVLTAI